MMEEGKEQKFALMLTRTVVGDKSSITMSSKNSGVSEADIIVYVESWLDILKGNVKKKIIDGTVVSEG